MSEGFSRPFHPVSPRSARCLVWWRRGPEGVEVYTVSPHEAVADERSDRTVTPADWGERALRVSLDEGGAVPAHAVPLGTWRSPDFAPARWELTLTAIHAQEQSHPPDVGGAWTSVDARTDGYQGPLMAALASALTRLAEASSPGELPSTAEALEARPDVWVVPVRTPTLPPATHTNAVVLGRGRVVVVDPASPYVDEQARLATWVRRQMGDGGSAQIVLTHHHRDHVGGVNALRELLGAPVLAHPRTAALLAESVAVDSTLNEGDRLELGGGGDLDVLHTPGHASGHLVLHSPERRLQIVGDMVAGHGTIVIDPPDGHMSTYIASLERLRGLGDGIAVPSHGPLIVRPPERYRQYVMHRHWREGVVLKALREGGPSTVSALLPKVYGDVDPRALPIASRQALAHLEKLVEDGAVAQHEQEFSAV